MLIAAIRGVIEGDRYPHASRLDPLRAALARLEAAGANQNIPDGADTKSLSPEGPPRRRARPTSGRGDNRRPLAIRGRQAVRFRGIWRSGSTSWAAERARPWRLAG